MIPTKLAGLSLFLMTLLSIASAMTPHVSPLAGAIFAWLAFVLLVRQLPRTMLVQITVMVLIGIVCLIASVDDISQLPFVKIFSANHQLLAVIAAVTFLRLVTDPESSNDKLLPVGKTAVLKTLWGLHFFSSVITLSAMMIFGSRIEKEATINRLHAIMFSRTFACGCFWSPFYVALATALIYAPGSNLLVLALAGIPVALFGLVLTSLEFMRDEEVDTTAGFPVHMDALLIPVALSVLMIVSHLLLPGFPVLSLISLLSLLLTLLILFFKSPADTIEQFKHHINVELPKISRELSLFLAAGVMSTGLTLLINSSEMSLSIPEFTPLVGYLFIIFSIVVSLIGVHPIVTISVVGSLLTTTDFNPNLLGICMMMMWGLGIVISPLSGINLAIQGRFNISAFSIMRWNASYVVGMFVFCSILLYLYSHASFI